MPEGAVGKTGVPGGDELFSVVLVSTLINPLVKKSFQNAGRLLQSHQMPPQHWVE